MTHRTNPRFWRCYQGLPKEIRDLAVLDGVSRGMRQDRLTKAGYQGAAADEPRSKAGQIEAARRRGSRLSADR